MLIKGNIHGTPRTYGNRKTEDAWRTESCRGRWTGCDGLSLPLTEQLEARFDFRVNPGSPKYYGAVSLRGPDLDTMVVGALDGLIDGRNRERPSTRFLQSARILNSVTASKTLADSDEECGVIIEIQPCVEHHFKWHQCAFGFDVTGNKPSDLRKAVKNAAEHANTMGFRAPADLPLHIQLRWGSSFCSSNVHSADKLEAVIDGLGASIVPGSGLRFFDPPPSSRFAEYGYDDSGVFSLRSVRDDAAPSDLFVRIEVAACSNG